MNGYTVLWLIICIAVGFFLAKEERQIAFDADEARAQLSLSKR